LKRANVGANYGPFFVGRTGFEKMTKVAGFETIDWAAGRCAGFESQDANVLRRL
jgi:hypothetical protein